MGFVPVISVESAFRFSFSCVLRYSGGVFLVFDFFLSCSCSLLRFFLSSAVCVLAFSLFVLSIVLFSGCVCCWVVVRLYIFFFFCSFSMYFDCILSLALFRMFGPGGVFSCFFFMFAIFLLISCILFSISFVFPGEIIFPFSF